MKCAVNGQRQAAPGHQTPPRLQQSPENDENRGGAPSMTEIPDSRFQRFQTEIGRQSGRAQDARRCTHPEGGGKSESIDQYPKDWLGCACTDMCTQDSRK